MITYTSEVFRVLRNMAENVDLKVSRDLIDAQFDGYKLSLDSLPIHSSKFKSALDIAQITEEQYSYNHAKLLGIHNHLFLDLWTNRHVYFINEKWAIVKAAALEKSISEEGVVAQIPDVAKQQSIPGRYNVSLIFMSEEFVAVADGAGKLHIFETGDRNSGALQKWKIVFSLDPLSDGTPFMLVDAVMPSGVENHQIDCLCAHVIESKPNQTEQPKSAHQTILEWITISSADKHTWTVERRRKLVGLRPFDYVSFDKLGSSVIMSAEGEYRFESDSLKPVVQDVIEEPTREIEGQKEYTWNQTKEDVNVCFTVPKPVTKADIYLTLSFDHIDFGLKNSKTLLKGQLHSAVDVEASTWTIEGQRLELTLGKKDEEIWPEVVVGDDRGEMTMDPVQIASIHERLAHLTSEQLNPDPEENQQKPFNSQQLEDCDVLPGQSSTLMRIDGNTHKTTHQTNLGSHQFLFNCSLDKDKPMALCLRHDVDGLVWQPDNILKENQSPWQHVATFDAFGYVQASKQQRKFSSCPPNCSYAVICDIHRYCYIYRKPSSISTSLRNRKTGRQVSAVAKQQVVTLESVDNIVGMQATDEKLFIATISNLYAVQVNTTEI